MINTYLYIVKYGMLDEDRKRLVTYFTNRKTIYYKAHVIKVIKGIY